MTKTTLALTSAVALTAALTASGCALFAAPPPEPEPADAGEPAPEPEPSDAGTPDAGPLVTPTIASFAAAPETLTAGVGADGEPVQGETVLSWTVQDAVALELYQDDTLISLARCAPASGDDCLQDATLTVRPTVDTRYRLVASATDAPCTFGADGAPTEPGRCVTASVDIEVLPPPLVTLTSDDTEVIEGDDATVHYEVQDASEFALGLVEVVGGSRTFRPCALEGDGAPNPPCVLPASGGEADLEGDIVFTNVTAPLTVGATASGLAGDGVGDIAAGDVELAIQVLGAPTVTDFTVDDDTVQAGDRVSFSWTTADADAVSLSASPNSVVQADLAACTGAGAGSCDVGIAAGTPAGEIVFSLVASAAGKPDSAPASRVVEVGEAPAPQLTASPTELPEGGGSVTIGWTAPGANQVRLTDDVISGAHVDTSDGTGDASCTGGEDAAACEPEADDASIADITVTTRFTLAATNAFGTRTASATVQVEGQPTITGLTLDGEDALAGAPLIVDGDDATLAFTTENAASTTLSRAPAPLDGCDAATGFVEDGDFTGGTSGNHSLTELTASLCFELVANGGAGQSASARFYVVRTPTISAFTPDDDTITIGQPLTLSWQSENALATSMTVSPVGAVTSDDLAGCDAVDGSGAGSCTVSIQPGTPRGDVTFSLVAHGREDTASPASTLAVTVGDAPAIVSFENDPAVIAAPTDVELSWTSSDGASLAIEDDTGALLFDTTTLADIDAGTFTVSQVDATRTFTLIVSSEYGEDSAQVTTFFGPSFDTLTTDGDDAIDGLGEALTGDVTVAWSTTNADDVELFVAPAPGDGDCAALAPGAFSSVVQGAPADSATLTDVIADTCLRLIATNAAAQSSELRALLKDRPEATSLTTSPGTITRSEGGTIVVDMSARGATALDLVADYLDGDDNVIGSSAVCDEGSLNSGSLTGGTEADSASCSDNYDAPAPVCIGCRLIPQGTDRIRYRLQVRDEEADAADLDSAGGEDVTVQ